MATYLELQGMFNDNDLTLRSATAVIIGVDTLLSGTPTAADRKFADAAAADPVAVGKKALMFVLAANKDASVAAIQGSTDSQLQTNVDAVLPALVSALSEA